MSVISSRKSLNSSILKSTSSRLDSLKKTKTIRFAVDLADVKHIKVILKDLEDNPNTKSYQNLIYKLAEADLKVKSSFSFILLRIFMSKVILRF